MDNLKNAIYASYGLIMKSLQNSELLLVQVIYSVKRRSGNINSEEQKSDDYTKLLSYTFGQLLTMMKEIVVDSDIEIREQYNEHITQIKKLRNHFAHNYFKEFMNLESHNMVRIYGLAP